MDTILNTIKMVRDAGFQVGLNSVIQSDDISSVKNLIELAIQYEIPLKLLPQIGLKGSDKFKEFIIPLVEEYACEYLNKGTGALRWTLKSGSKRIILLLIDSPCFYNDIQSCRNFGELRINPDFSLQPCILRQPSERLKLSQGKELVINQLAELWKHFTIC